MGNVSVTEFNGDHTRVSLSTLSRRYCPHFFSIVAPNIRHADRINWLLVSIFFVLTGDHLSLLPATISNFATYLKLYGLQDVSSPKLMDFSSTGALPNSLYRLKECEDGFFSKGFFDWHKSEDWYQ